ncbi:hypothetical protein PV726_39495 [Streptomyces europaeiscabiei]|uniref:hypothetical protein n=1 Tax=Streptomyces europaeiscabiei TaxID=146819 RepID=UPI0029BD56BB|nr:hypothetical protein [Streptomyces europaeiscabiei]MDX3696293.1 hypothetical protein [Streptomyces europaeiscabiei]
MAAPWCSAHSCSARRPGLNRAAATIERLKPAIRSDDTVPAPTGIEDEHAIPLGLSPMVEPPSRALFTPAQIDADRGRFEVEQSDDGGGEFHFRHWMPVQSAEWCGVVALGARCTISGRTPDRE